MIFCCMIEPQSRCFHDIVWTVHFEMLGPKPFSKVECIDGIVNANIHFSFVDKTSFIDDA